MPKINLGTIGSSLNFTAKIPSEVGRFLQERDLYASVGLTPSFGKVPEIPVHRLCAANVSVPSHWRPEDVLVPMVHGCAFYISEIELAGCAVSWSMAGVNIRHGLPETEGPVSDKPSQSYWAPGVPLPYIDGYVPSDGDAVCQFAPLRGERELVADVSRHVGIRAADPFRDALRGRFFARVVPPQPQRVTRGPYKSTGPSDAGFGGGGLESLTYSGPSDCGFADDDYLTRGDDDYPVKSMSGSRPTVVGMGAGARMGQRHPHNHSVQASDFRATPSLEITFRLLWDAEWSTYAREIQVPIIDKDRLDQLRRQQAEYEDGLCRRLGIRRSVFSKVDDFPQIP